jgi:Family of unknown function (DUF6535)
MYSEMTEEGGKKMAECWQESAKVIIIFVRISVRFPYHFISSHINSISQCGLFSAALALFLVEAIQDLKFKISPQEAYNFYLKHIYDQSVGHPSAALPPFAAPKSTPWVVSLVSLSLFINLTCIIKATLRYLRARKYLSRTQGSRTPPSERARIHGFFATSLDPLQFSREVETMRLLMKSSVFLFFAGLLVYLSNINHAVFITAFIATLCWASISTLRYVMPIIRVSRT